RAFHVTGVQTCALPIYTDNNIRIELLRCYVDGEVIVHTTIKQIAPVYADRLVKKRYRLRCPERTAEQPSGKDHFLLCKDVGGNNAQRYEQAVEIIARNGRGLSH